MTTRRTALAAAALIGLAVGVPAGWLASEVHRGWRSGSTPTQGDPPPFAPELASAPRHPLEPDGEPGR